MGPRKTYPHSLAKVLSPAFRLPPASFLLLILLLHFALALAYAAGVPLGEAPDEPAHLSYARFIARHGRLPASLEEREEAGYRSAWPPLYHFLAAGPLALVGDQPPARLKAVGDTPRRLIPTNGQTIAAFIHTADESPPWRGLPLAWHLARLISVSLTTLSVALTYAIARRLTGRPGLAAAAAALHAFIPQVLFIGSVLNDDNLLVFLAGLIFLTLVKLPSPAKAHHLLGLGALLGLASVAKYNALPLWAIVIVWLIWPRASRAKRGIQPPKNNNSSFMIRHWPFTIPLLLLGALLSGGWWFIFVWRSFNRVEQLGWLSGSLAALSAGASDASLRQLAAGQAPSLPALSAWPEWFITLFETFWGSFGGGATIDLPAWVYALLVIVSLVAMLMSFTIYTLRSTHQSQRPSGSARLWRSGAPRTILQNNYQLPITLFLLSPLFFLPLPMLRFILTGSLVETAQGRHLFPALPAIALGLVWGLASVRCQASGVKHHASRLLPWLPAAVALGLSLYSLGLIRAAYPPPIPLRTTPDAAAAANLLQVEPAESIALVGYELGPVEPGILPVTLVWQAKAIPPEDYLIELSLSDAQGQPLGSWLGHPLGGRYPTRAWDKGDILRHTILLPLLPLEASALASLSLRLLDSSNQPASPAITLTSTVSLPPAPALPRAPAELRADELPAAAPFAYRSTLSLALPGHAPPRLLAPTGQSFSPASFITDGHNSLAHFIVAADWPSGEYQLTNFQLPIPIFNRPRRFTPPAMQHVLQANFAGTMTLLGYDLPQRRVQPGQSFPLTLHWQAQRSMGQHLIIFNHLLDQSNTQRGGADRVPQLYYTTLLWVPGEVVSDSYLVPVDAAAPPGVYWLDVGLYPAVQPTFSLPLWANGQPSGGNSVRLGPLKVGGPPPGLTTGVVQPQNPLALNFGGQITLLGFTFNAQHLTLFWQAGTIPQADYTVFVHLVDPSGRVVKQFDSPPANGAYLTSLWDAGEIIVDERRLSDLPPGRYEVMVGLYDPASGQRLPVEGAAEGAVKLMELEVR